MSSSVWKTSCSIPLNVDGHTLDDCKCRARSQSKYCRDVYMSHIVFVMEICEGHSRSTTLSQTSLPFHSMHMYNKLNQN